MRRSRRLGSTASCEFDDSMPEQPRCEQRCVLSLLLPCLPPCPTDLFAESKTISRRAWSFSVSQSHDTKTDPGWMHGEAGSSACFSSSVPPPLRMCADALHVCRYNWFYCSYWAWLTPRFLLEDPFMPFFPRRFHWQGTLCATVHNPPVFL